MKLKKVLGMLTIIMVLVLMPKFLNAGNGPSTEQNQLCFESYIRFYNSNGNITQMYYYIFGCNNVLNQLNGATYDRETNTLTLNNLNNEYWLELKMMGEDFKINLVGNNKIGQIEVFGNEYGGSVHFVGNGSLTINTQNSDYTPIKINAEGSNSQLIVDDTVTLNLYSRGKAIDVNQSIAENGIVFNNKQNIEVSKKESTVRYGNDERIRAFDLVHYNCFHEGFFKVSKEDDLEGYYATDNYIHCDLDGTIRFVPIVKLIKINAKNNEKFIGGLDYCYVADPEETIALICNNENKDEVLKENGFKVEETKIEHPIGIEFRCPIGRGTKDGKNIQVLETSWNPLNYDSYIASNGKTYVVGYETALVNQSSLYTSYYQLDTYDYSVSGRITKVKNAETLAEEEKNKDREGTLGYLGYKIEKQKVTITSIDGNPLEVIVPDTIEEFPVVSLAEGLFKGNNNLEKVTMPDSITKLGDNIFEGCTKLNSVYLSNKIDNLPKFAFKNCKELKNIEIPNSVTSICDSAFESCTSLENVKLPQSNLSIKNGVFWGCLNLKTIDLPNQLQEIGSSAFARCSKLTNIAIPNSLTQINYNAFGECASLTSISIPEGITKIDSNAFVKCISLKNIVLPSTLKEIGSSSFQNCTNLNNIEIPNNVDEIKLYTFKDCTNLEEVTILNGVQKIGEEAFLGCTKLKKIKIPDTVKTLEMKSFKNCYMLTEVELSKNITKIGDEAFYFCSGLKKIDIPESVAAIGKSAFFGCTEFTRIVIPSKVRTLQEKVFYNCKNLSCIIVPKTVTSIHESTFTGCNNLTLVVEPNSYTEQYAKIFNIKYVYNEKEIENKTNKVVDISKAEVIGINNKTYNGRNITQNIIIKYENKILINGVDYNVKYSNNKKVGIASVFISGIGGYKGSITKSFTINPKPVTIKKLTKKSKGFNVNWKKQTEETTGYQIQYSTNKNFTSGNKTVNITKNKTTSKSISKLKAKKKYYVRIRTYKKVNGKKIYSSWSNSKSVKTKK